MANRIHILPDEIANRIAAGEVVDRPASVAKELMENAVDGNTDRIIVEVSAGGKESLRVSDNGCGMSRDEAILALERYATSKITNLSDLRTLSTFGFRGEALPSISAVSRMVLETCPEGIKEGTRIIVDGGKIRDVSPFGRASGTTITITGLFFNVPARRKFLKSSETEFRHTVNAVTALALAYPKIAIMLSHNSREVLNLERSDRKQRIETIFGVKFGQDAVFVEGGEDPLQAWGFVGRPEGARKSGAQQVLIVNGRWVKHKGITFAVYDGYGGLLPKGLIPPFVLFLDVDPSRLDVNVHPSKREIRFADEHLVYRTLARVVRHALREVDLIPRIDSNHPGSAVKPASILQSSKGKLSDEVSNNFLPAVISKNRLYQSFRSELPGIESGPQIALPLTVKAASQGPVSRAPLEDEQLLELDEKFSQISIWQLHQKYILAHIKNGVIIFDQYLAHQRILYEKVLDNFYKSPSIGQRLLFPLTLDFGFRQIQFVRETIPLLEKMGFGIRDFGGNTVVIDAIPVDLKNWEDGALLREIVEDLLEDKKKSDSPTEYLGRKVTFQEYCLAASYAQHTAIPSGSILSIKEMQSLIDQLFATHEPFISPQGRPTVVKMSLEEIDKRFGR